MQLWAVLAFTKWLNCPAHCQQTSDFEIGTCISQLCKGLLTEFDSRCSLKYRGISLPKYQPLASMVEQKLLLAARTVTASHRPSPNAHWTLQQTLLIGLQVLIPPLRGETYWNMKLTPTKGASMTLFLSLKPFCTLHQTTTSSRMVM